MKQVKLTLKPKAPVSYAIQIGAGAIQKTPTWLKQFKTKRAFIISDEKLTAAREALRLSLQRAGWEIIEIPVAAGEGLKDMDVIYPLFGELLKKQSQPRFNSLCLRRGFDR